MKNNLQNIFFKMRHILTSIISLHAIFSVISVNTYFITVLRTYFYLLNKCTSDFFKKINVVVEINIDTN